MHSLLCWYCMRLGRLYYVIWTFHVLSLYITFLSHLLFLCVAVYLSSRLSLSPLSLFFSPTVTATTRERAFEIYAKRPRTVKLCLVFILTHTHPINTAKRGELHVMLFDQALYSSCDHNYFIVSKNIAGDLELLNIISLSGAR